MFGKGKKQENTEVKEKKESERGLTILKLCLPPIFIVALVVLVSGYIAYLQYAGVVKKAQQMQHVADADKLAAVLGGRLIALGDKVSSYTRADAALAASIAQGDSDALRGFEQELMSHFPEAVRIRIVSPDDIRPDNSVIPPISYACLDLARQAESGTDRPPIEIHLPGSAHAHLDMLRPIKYQGRVIASLLVSFEPGSVKEWITELSPQGGYVELQQGADGPVLGRAGNAGAQSGEPSHRALIAGSAWQLSYWPTDSIGMEEAQKLGFLITFAVTAVVIAALMFFYSIFLSSTIKRELEGVATFMVESGRGQRFHSYPVKMVEMEKTLQAMEPVLEWLKSSDDGGIKEKAESGDEGASDMMFMDFGEITVEESETPSKGDADKS